MELLINVLNSSIITNETYKNIKLYYIIYIIFCICICILIIYFFSLSIGIIKGTILSSNCNLESVEYESTRFQIYKTLLYFDKLLLFQILLGIILFLMFIVFITFIYFIASEEEKLENITTNKRFIIPFIIWFGYLTYLISRSMYIYTNQTDNILISLQEIGDNINDTVDNTTDITDAIEEIEVPSINRDEIIASNSVYFVATFIYIIVIITYLLPKLSDNFQFFKENCNILTMWIIVISICYLLLLCLQTFINIFGNNFKNEYEQYIKNLNKQFTLLLGDNDSHKLDVNNIKYLIYNPRENIWDYYMFLANEPILSNDLEKNFFAKESVDDNKNYYIRRLKEKVTDVDDQKKTKQIYHEFRDKFNKHYKKDFITIIRNLNGNCDRHIPNDLNQMYFNEKFNPTNPATGRILEKFMDLTYRFESKLKEHENLNDVSINQICLNNYNALHELKESKLSDDTNDKCIELFKVLYIPLFEHNTHKFEKNLEKLNVITKLTKKEQTKVKLTNFNLIFNGIIKTEKKYFNYDIIQQISAGICFLIVFFICLAFYMLFKNIYTTGIIITIAVIILSITILTIVRIISEGIH